MNIKEHGMGWIIEPVTSDQRQALEKIIEGLRMLFPLPLEPTGGGDCAACPARRFHMSDCAVHNEPAMTTGPCDCGLHSPNNTNHLTAVQLLNRKSGDA